jgi:hypothetical protein
MRSPLVTYYPNKREIMIPNIAKTLSVAAAGWLILSACEPSTGPDKTETTLPPLEKWSFNRKETSFKSGIAVRGRDVDGKLATGVTVWLTDQSIDCSTDAANLPIMRGGWVGIKFPEISLGKGLVRVIVGSWPDGGGLNGNIDDLATATLSKADTSGEKTVSGSLDFHNPEIDAEDGFGKADVTGSFSVPYCPGK